MLSYTVSIIWAIVLMFNNAEEYPVIDMISQFICKFSIACAFQACYLANELFPIVFASTTFGACVSQNSLASYVSIWIIYDYTSKWPWYIYIGFCFVGMLCSLLLRDPN